MTVTASWNGGRAGAWGVLIHGGAGDVPEGRRAGQADGCRIAAAAAAAVLERGGNALDAVQRAAEILEDDPRFNAGTGASLTRDGHLELDACVMEGRDLRAGGVCSLSPFKNPIAIARAVLEDGEHVLYSAAGADDFARRAGFTPADEEAMITERARLKLESALEAGHAANWAGGTVGAVARDGSGLLAAATSTGGTAAKRPGRVGDTPIVGAGTYADNRAGAASATGQGEGILRVVLCAGAVSAMQRGVLPEAAARQAVELLRERTGAGGGLILVDALGRLGFARSTGTMSWAAAWEGAPVQSGA